MSKLRVWELFISGLSQTGHIRKYPDEVGKDDEYVSVIDKRNYDALLAENKELHADIDKLESAICMKCEQLLAQAESMAQSIQELIEHFAEERKFAERGRWKTVEIDLKKLINLDNVLSDWQKFKEQK